jgi:hypothetical protein
MKPGLAHRGILNTHLLKSRSAKECKTGKYRKLPKRWIEISRTTPLLPQEE